MLIKFTHVLLCTFLCLTVSFAYAQSVPRDSAVHTLDEVIIPSNRLKNFTTGSKIEEIDSTVIAQNSNNTLADLLGSQTQVFVKSYGIAGLSSPSFRGTSAAQTAILWNGFNLGSAMNGSIDLALMPVNFANNIKLQFGGAGALWGSGAVGGTIHLSNTAEFNKGISLGSSTSIGSFGDKQQNFEAGFSSKRFISVTKFFYHEAKNNFPFINNTGFEATKQRLNNAEMDQKGLMQELYYKINTHQTLSFRFWYQKNNRNIPNSISLSDGKANQKDDAIRSTIEWQRIKNRVSYFVRAACFDEKLDYTDPLISLISNSQTKTFISEAEAKINLTELQAVNIGVNNTYNTAFTANYVSNPTQNRTAIFGSYSIRNAQSTLKGTASARKESIYNGKSPFTASMGFQGLLLKVFRLRANASKTYRIPTFNDLYWQPGGNINLQPEEGYSEEIGIAYINCKAKTSIEYEITTFNSNINNWIMWVPPTDGSSIWSPKNIQKVWSRGIENDLKLHYTAGKFKFGASGHYQYILTTNEETTPDQSASLHKQLIYIPIHKGLATLSVQYRNFRIACTYNYVGYRFKNSDNSTKAQDIMDPYHTFNIDLSKAFKVSYMLFKAYVQVNNITDESYQTVPNYATPGRNYQAGITINLNKPNKI